MSFSTFETSPQWGDDPALTDGVLTRRVWAFVVDGLLVSLLCGLLWLLLLTFGVLTLGLGLPLLGLIPFVPFLYNWLSLLGRVTATPGQALLGLRVRRDADLGSPDPIQALAWSAGFAVTFLVGAWPFLAALVTPRHRTLHDLVSGLVVVRSQAVRRVSLTGPGPTWNTGAGRSNGPTDAAGAPAFE